MQKTRTGRRVTSADVARSLGLSRATVGFVLNNTPGQTIPKATRDRVLAEASRLGYRPHSSARALASGHSRIILLVLPDWPHDYSVREHLDEASVTLDRAGYSLVTMTPHPDGQARPLWETLDPDVVIGMAPFTTEQLAAMRASGVQRIIPDQPVIEQAGQPTFAIGPKLQVEHLIARGRTRLAFAGSSDPRLADLVEQRRDLARRTLRSLNGAELRATDIDRDNAAATVAEWTALGVDAVVAYNDEIAALVAGAALRAGIRIPDELAVIGHDDTPLAQLFVPSLSSIHVDTAGLGRYLAELALSAAEGTPAPTADPETDAKVIVRESTGQPIRDNDGATARGAL